MRLTIGAQAAWLIGMALFTAMPLSAGAEASIDADTLAKQVTIVRDRWGTPHIDGPTDAAVIFGFGYAQAEDYFWQVEDNFLLALGRYSEFHGPIGLNSDMLNRAFEVVPRTKADFGKLDPATQETCAAFAAGINHYLKSHPEVKPRGITRFEPWHVIALIRQLTVELCFRYTRLSSDYAPRANKMINPGIGSNAWAVGPSKTASGKAMLVINPHQPWFGFGQFCEAHLRSGDGWEMSGGAFFGLPTPFLGYNHERGWAATTNEPDIADVWRETFDDKNNPLQYRYGKGYKTASEWKETIRIKTTGGFQDRVVTFRKTHHGPIVGREDQTHFLSANIAKLHESDLIRQGRKLLRAKNFAEWRAALGEGNFQYMNLVYADKDGNIFYYYGGIVPRRDLSFNWSKPVDGSDPRTEWNGFHSLDELPQALNPPTGYVQNCNSTPFTTTDEGSPFLGDFPPYMVEDKHDDKRRAKRARQMLREMKGVTHEQMSAALFDTTMFWAYNDLPKYAWQFESLKKEDPKLAAEVEPYLKHLLEWDSKVTGDSTAATLAAQWYEELYGFGYPHETLLPRYLEKPNLRFKALVEAADKLKGFHGDWKVKWGDVHRIQRHANVTEFILIPFDDEKPSLPSWGCPSPPGVLFTTMYTPSMKLPFVRPRLKQYGVVGLTYAACVEFGDKPKAATLLQFGQSGDPRSPHYFDQARLLSERKLKPSTLDWSVIRAEAESEYRPGERPTIKAAAGGGN